MGAWVRIAQITKTRSMQGSVVAQSACGLPFLLSAGLQVHFVPPLLKGPNVAQVEYVRCLKPGSYEVKFKGIDSMEEASRYAGLYCLALKSDVPETLDDESPESWIGYRVIDATAGDLGCVDSVMSSVAQSILVVQGQTHQVMIPIVDAFVKSVDVQKKSVAVDVPESLIDLDSTDEIEGLQEDDEA